LLSITTFEATADLAATTVRRETFRRAGRRHRMSNIGWPPRKPTHICLGDIGSKISYRADPRSGLSRGGIATELRRRS
jgi:hypothetical protein